MDIAVRHSSKENHFLTVLEPDICPAAGLEVETILVDQWWKTFVYTHGYSGSGGYLKAEFRRITNDPDGFHWDVTNYILAKMNSGDSWNETRDETIPISFKYYLIIMDLDEQGKIEKGKE